MKTRHKEALFSELASLLSSGLDFARAFSLLIQTRDDPEVLKKLLEDVIAGASLHEAMARSGGSFTPLDTGVVRIGEQTGRLDESLRFLADHYAFRAEQKRMITSAISYPIVILCTAVAVVIFMLIFVVPMFQQVYDRMGGQLPALTQWIISFSKSAPDYLSIFALILAIAAIFLYTFRHHEKVRRTVASVILGTPIVGDIVRTSTQANICKLLHLLIGSGIPLLTSIEMLHSIITLYPYQRSFATVAEGLCRGELLSENLSKNPKLYNKKMTTLLTVGEQTNRLPQMLHSHGDDLSHVLKHRIRTLGTLLEPLLILLVGSLVAIILTAMYLPMFNLGNTIN